MSDARLVELQSILLDLQSGLDVAFKALGPGVPRGILIGSLKGRRLDSDALKLLNEILGDAPPLGRTHN